MKDMIRKHRIKKHMTQQELAEAVHTSKRAVSSWETGRTMPDSEALRRLSEVLEIPDDRILESAVSETNKSKLRLRLCAILLGISMVVAILFGINGMGWMRKHSQSGVTILTVYYNHQLLRADAYTLTIDAKSENMKNGYRFETDYGESRGVVRLSDGLEIEFGFVNTNNWHNIQIRLDVNKNVHGYAAKQTVTYATDAQRIDVFQSIDRSENLRRLCVFKEGL